MGAGGTAPSQTTPGECIGLSAGHALDDDLFAQVRRRAILEGCKLDPQVGDVSTLAAFPIVLSSAAWQELAALSEKLASETVEIEQEILHRPELLDELGLPRQLRAALSGATGLTPAAARTMRFDYHPTTEGWRLSEVNSDVPGGFTEASCFTGLMAEHFPDTHPAGDPVRPWADAIARAAGDGARIGLLTAPGFMEDHQIMLFLAARLRERGCETHLANPAQLVWRDGFAHLETSWFQGRLQAVVRFYQAEWLPTLPRRCGWRHFFRDGRTPVANPGLAAISESKRLPLLWDRLAAALPAWRRLLPETRTPRQAPWENDPGWLIKSAYSNTGDEVCVRELMAPQAWRRVRWEVRLSSGRWLAQRRFESIPVPTPSGPRHVCVGVHTINGKAAGAYARLSNRPLIDYGAVDVAVLVQHNHDNGRDF